MGFRVELGTARFVSVRFCMVGVSRLGGARCGA